MLKSIFKYATLFATAFTSLCYADSQTTFEVGVGYRRDFMKWKAEEVAGAPVAAIVGTELESVHRFKNMDIFTIDADVKIVDCWYYFRASADYGWICSGKDHARFEAEVPGVGEFNAHINRKIKGNYVADLSAAIGYPFEWCCGDFVFAPLIGYSYHTQQLKVRHHGSGILFPTEAGITFVRDADETEGKFRASWYGPFVGFDLAFHLDDCWSLYGEFEYHFGQCKRKRDTNIGIASFDHFNRTKRAHGFNGTVGADYFFCCDWYAGLSVDMKYWRSKHSGSDRVDSSSSDVVASSISDTIDWSSVGVNLNIGYLF